MSMKGFLISISVLILCFSSGLNADDSRATLDSLIDAALKNNPGLMADRYAYQSAEYSALAARALPDPTLTFGVVNLPRTSLSLNETPMTGITVGIAQTIPWPGKLSARSRIGELQSEIKSTQVDARENRLIRQITESYYEYSYRTFELDLLDRNLALIENLIGSAETNYANGLGSAQDLLRGQTSYSRLENRKLQAELGRQKALNMLALLTNDYTLISANLQASLPDDIERESISDPKDISDDNPDIRVSALNSDLAEKKLSLAKADYWPNLMLGVEYRIREEVPGDPVKGEDYLSAKIGLSIPLWFFSRQKNMNRSARVGIQAARAYEQNIMLTFEQLLADSRLELGTIRESLAFYDSAILPQARAAFEAAQVAYEVGQVDFNALLGAQTELLQVELERLNNIKEYYQNHARLMEIIGRKADTK
jgi:cobalt-zinc-cadmium efflux system outer membrane protein